MLPLGTSAPINGIGIVKQIGPTDGLGNITDTNLLTKIPLYKENGEYLSGRNPLSTPSSPFGTITAETAQSSFTGSRFPAYTALQVNSDNYTADLTQATAATVNQLRMAIALQQMYELDARGGTRYIEIIKNHFGVQSSDARLQRAEYLGGKNIPIQISQVIQTSETASESPQGNTAGMSLTFDQDEYFTKSFEEHGTILILGAIKQEQSYQQGLPKMFSRFKRTDFYDPIFANIGEQPIYNREIYAQGTDVDEEVFGYQEAWADYRYKPNQVSGEFRSNDENTLDFWHLANDFSSLPTLGEDFIKETTANLDRALTVPSTTQDQFIADFYFDAVAVRPMPPHSIPGLKRL